MAATSDSSTAARVRPPLPRRSVVLLILFVTGAAVSWYGLVCLRRPLAMEGFTVADTAPIPVERVRLAGRESYPVHFLLLPGYGGNRRQMLHLGEVLAAAGAQVFIVDLPGRGNNTAPASPLPPDGPHATMPTPRETEAALAVVRQLESQFGVSRDHLVVVGHSMGGGVAIDLGHRVEPAATVSLAGLCRPVAPGEPPNLFLVTARLEIPQLRWAANRMYLQARSGHAPQPSLVARSEFSGTHSSLPFHSGVQQAVVDWANRVVPGAQLAIPPHLNASLLALEFAALFFLCALFVPLALLASWVLHHEPLGEVVPETRVSFGSWLHVGGYALLAGGGAVSALALASRLSWPPPLTFLRLQDGAYLASVLLLATAWLLPVLRHRPWVRSGRETAASVGVSLTLVAYLMLVGGGFLNWQLFDLWPTPGRFLRLGVLVVLLFPYALGEELLLRTFSQQPRSGSPLRAFLFWRLGLLAAIVYGVFALGSGEAMLVLVALPVFLLSLLEYFFAAVLARALASPYAGAVFHTLLISWFLAAFFPLG